MTPEEKSLLERTYKLVEENNNYLKGIRRSARIGNIARIIYWVVIILLSVGAYYAIQPYVNFLTSSFGNLTGAHSANGVSVSLQDLFK